MGSRADESQGRETVPDMGKTQTWQTRSTITKANNCIVHVHEEAEETESDGEDSESEDN